ncbi:MAG: nucleotide exchange factor GrpE [Clostridiales bacterium]|nr:nucleotide exchange factor GrpE [Clostridiales bacterium]
MSEKEIKEEIEEEKPQEAEPETEEEAPKSREEELEEKLQEQTDKYMRLYAEYDNFRKRSAREKDARYTDALVDVVSAILPVGDNLERALQTQVTSEDALKFKEGVEMVMKQYRESLEKLGVTAIEAVGEQFDPNFHNAIMHMEDDSIDDNTVVEEFMKGYKYKDSRVVRHSMVKVAN